MRVDGRTDGKKNDDNTHAVIQLIIPLLYMSAKMQLFQ